MGTSVVKTTYTVEGAYGSTEQKTLYAKHYRVTDHIIFFDENGKYLFGVSDYMGDNIIDAIDRLFKNQNENIDEKVYRASPKEKEKLQF